VLLLESSICELNMRILDLIVKFSFFNEKWNPGMECTIVVCRYTCLSIIFVFGWLGWSGCFSIRPIYNTASHKRWCMQLYQVLENSGMCHVKALISLCCIEVEVSENYSLNLHFGYQTILSLLLFIPSVVPFLKWIMKIFVKLETILVSLYFNLCCANRW